MALTTENILDLVKSTLAAFDKLTVTDLSATLQEYVAMSRILNKETVKETGGSQIEFQLVIDDNGAAKNIGLYETDSYTKKDILAKGVVPWRSTKTDYIISEQEISMNTTPKKIVDLLKVQRHGAMQSFAGLMEANFWGTPSSSSDYLTPWGVGYWIVKNATAGFTGGYPTGWTTMAGLDLTSGNLSRFKNYSAAYTTVSKADLVTAWRKAATLCNFKSPVTDGVPSNQRGKSRYGYYVPYSVLASLEALAEDQNDNLGNDIASKDGATLFRGTPVTWVPYLDSDTDYPVYGIDWSYFYPEFLSGWQMRESDPHQVANMHTVIAVDIDNVYNFVCRNRRNQFVLFVN